VPFPSRLVDGSPKGWDKRVRRDDGIWRLASLDVIYEKDMLAPVNPSDQLMINREELRQYRPSYRLWLMGGLAVCA
jgi:hypothetical protein